MAEKKISEGLKTVSSNKPRTSTVPSGQEKLKEPQQFARRGDNTTFVDFRGLSAYDRIKHTYENSNGYLDNSYLIFFQREEYYQERQRYSENTAPAFQQVVDAMVRPVFEKQINRKTNNPMFELFIKNCDGTGTTIQNFVKSVITHARMYNLTFVLMENKHEEEATTLLDVLSNRKIPYVCEKEPSEVFTWKTNKHGKLVEIVFNDVVIEKEVNKKLEKIQTYKRVDNILVQNFYIEKNKDIEKEIIIKEYEHNFGELPVYPVLDFSDSKNLSKFPNTKLLNLAMTSWQCYNVNSWIMMQGVYQFPILTIPNLGVNQIALSQNNAIQIPDDATFAPAFIAPPSTSIEVLMKLAEKLEEKIYKQAEQLGVTGTKTSAMASGVSKEWDFRGSNSLLKETASAAKNLEIWLSEIFAKQYINQTINYEVVYPTAFVEAYTNQRLEQITNLLKTPGISLVIVKELNKQLATILFSENQTLVEEIIQKIEEEDETEDEMDTDKIFGDIISSKAKIEEEEEIKNGKEEN